MAGIQDRVNPGSTRVIRAGRGQIMNVKVDLYPDRDVDSTA